MYPVLKARGIIIAFWTPNTQSEFSKIFLRYGDNIDGCQTDKPSVLTKWTKAFRELKHNINVYSLSRQSSKKDEEDLMVVELI